MTIGEAAKNVSSESAGSHLISQNLREEKERKEKRWPHFTVSSSNRINWSLLQTNGNSSSLKLISVFEIMRSSSAKERSYDISCVDAVCEYWESNNFPRYSFNFPARSPERVIRTYIYCSEDKSVLHYLTQKKVWHQTWRGACPTDLRTV